MGLVKGDNYLDKHRTWIKIFPTDAVSVLSGAATQLRVD